MIQPQPILGIVRNALLILLCFSALTSSAQSESDGAQQTLRKFFNESDFNISGAQIKNASGQNKTASGNVSFFGVQNVGLDFTFNPETKEAVSLQLDFPASSKFNLASIARLSKGNFRRALPNNFAQSPSILIETLAVQFEGGAAKTVELNLLLKEWDFLNFGQFKLNAVKASMALNPSKSKVTGSIKGFVSTKSGQFDIACAIDEKKNIRFEGAVKQSTSVNDMLRTIVGQQVLNEFYGYLPSAMLDGVSFNSASFVAIPNERTITISGASSKGNALLHVKAAGANKQIAMEIQPGKISNLVDTEILNMVDAVNPTIVATNFKKANYKSLLIPKAGEEKIQEGINVISTIDLGPDAYKIFKISQLNFTGSIDKSKRVDLAAKTKIEVPLGSDKILLKEFGFGLSSNPSPELRGAGLIDIKMSPKESLLFGAELNGKPLTMELGGKLGLITDTEDGIWRQPLGIPGIAISDVQGGIKVFPSAPFISELSLKGKVYLGKQFDNLDRCIAGTLDMNVSITNPYESHFVGELRNVNIGSFVTAYTDTKLSGELKKVLGTGIDRLRLEVVPKEQRFLAQGDFDVLGLKSNVSIAMNKGNLAISGAMDPLVIRSGNFEVFSITGVGQPRASFALQLGADPLFILNGKIRALETMEASASIKIDKAGFDLNMSGKIFNGGFSADLKAHGKILQSGTPSIYAELTMKQDIVSKFKTEMTAFIKGQANNSEQDILKARNSINSGSSFLDDVAKGSLTFVNGLQNATATAGVLVVEGLIPDIHSIKLKGSLDKVGVMAKVEVDYSIGKQRMQPFTFEINLKGNVAQELKRMAEALGKQTLKAFEALGEEIIKASGEVVKFFENVGQEVVKVAETTGKTVIHVVGAIDEAWNGKALPRPLNGPALASVKPGVRHYTVQLKRIQMVRADDKAFLGDAAIELYGGIYFRTNGMQASPGTNDIVFSVNRTSAQSWGTNASRNYNVSKHYYATDRSTHGVTIQIALLDSDDGGSVMEDDKFRGSKYINLSGWNWASGASQSFVVDAYESSSHVRISCTITLERKIGVQDFNAKIASRSTAQVKQLINLGGNIKEGCLLAGAIKNKDYNMLRFLLANGAAVCGNDLNMAMSATYYNESIAKALLIRSQPQTSHLTQAIAMNSSSLTALILSKGVQPSNQDLKKVLAKNQANNARLLLVHGAPVLPEDFTTTINQGNVTMAAVLMEAGQTPTMSQLHQCIQKKDKNMLRLFLNKVNPDELAFTTAVAGNDLELLDIVGASGVLIKTGEPAKKAIDLKHMALLNKTFDYGADPSTAMEYAVAKKDITSIRTCLAARGSATYALDYAVGVKDVNFYTELLTQHKANPAHALDQSVLANNTNFAQLAINNGASNVNNHLQEMANKGNEPMVRLLVNNNGNPNLAMMGSISNNKPALTQYLVENGADCVPPEYLLKTVELKSLPLTELLLKNGASPDAGMDKAIALKDYKMIELLLRYGAKPNNYIAAAAVANDLNQVQLYLKYGADANLGIKEAANKGHFEVVQEMLAYGASVGKLIAGPAASGNTKMVRLLLEYGANPSEGIKGAVKNNKTETAKLLLEYGASTEGIMKTAAGFGNKTLVRMLLDRGVDANEGIKVAVTNNHTDVSLLLLEKEPAITGLISIASRNGNLEIVSRLLDLKANPQEGILAAVEHKHQKVAEKLIQSGADVTEHIYLDKAIANLQTSMVVLLADNGCDVQHTNDKQESYLHLTAKIKGQDVLVKALMAYKIDLELKDNLGNTALHKAVKEGKKNLNTVMVLVEGGANINAVNNKGKIIFKEAKGSKIKKYLKEKGASKK